MAYSDLNQNQTISFNNLQSGVSQGVFTAKQGIPSSTKQVTKAEANTYININTSLPSFVNKASNALITKQDLSGITSSYPYLMYGVAGTSGYKSSDGGATWSVLSGLPSANWTGIAGDNSGTHIAVICQTQNNQVYVSNDGGASFTAVGISYILIGFYPTGIAMSANGQYISVSGVSTSSASGSNRNARVGMSNDYGASFSGGGWADGSGYNLHNDSGKVSVSGNGQYITAVFSYQVDPGSLSQPRPWSFRVYSSNYGATWTKSGGSEFCAFLDIALDSTGQNQFITSDWVHPGFTGSIGIKTFVSNNYGASWSEKFSNTTAFYLGGRHYAGFISATISDDGKTMVGASDSYPRFQGMNSNTLTPNIVTSSNYGASFTFSDGYDGSAGIAGGNITTGDVSNNYIAMTLKNIGQFNYSKNGGVSFLTATSGSYSWTKLYRKGYIYSAPPSVTSYVYYITPTDFTGQYYEYGCGSYDSTNSYTVYSDNSSFLSSTRFYTNSSLTTPFYGNNSTAVWWTDSNFENGCSIRINSSGYNIDQYCC